MSAERSLVSRRATLAAMGGSVAALGGCLGRPWSAWERDSPSQIELSILTPPEDDSIYALRIAQHLRSNLQRAGVRTDIVPTRTATFLREILINHNYDLYVWQHPPQQDPDLIRPLLHSTFAEERGWQNPYGFTNSVIDELLLAQLTAGTESARADHLTELQEVLQDERPFIPIGFKEESRLFWSDRVTPPEDRAFHSPTWLAELEGVDEDVERVQLGSTDARLTRNLNPVAVEYRGFEGVLQSLYGSLARPFDGTYRPWLAKSWDWLTMEFNTGPGLELTLRDGLEWHDGASVTAEDVAFTYAFLSDTTMTEEDPTIAAPRFRGKAGLVEAVEVIAEDTVQLIFQDASRPLVKRALHVPILPAHVWRDWTNIVEVAGIPIDDVTTDALVEANLDPVGCGPYRVTEVLTEDRLVLERIEDHPFVAVDPPDHPIPEIGPPALGEVVIDVRPSVSNITEAIRDGDLDGTLSGLGREAVEVGRSDPDLETVTQQTSRLFHVGFNHRDYSPLNHAGFRTGVERLIDRTYIRDEIFGGTPRMARTFVFDPTFVPAHLTWDEESTTFAGEPGTGELEPERAREPFREAGFRYSEEGALLVN